MPHGSTAALDSPPMVSFDAPAVFAGLRRILEAHANGLAVRRVQGKSCFNFRLADDPALGELERLAASSLERFRQRLQA